MSRRAVIESYAISAIKMAKKLADYYENIVQTKRNRTYSAV
jgi:hypothetical protein